MQRKSTMTSKLLSGLVALALLVPPSVIQAEEASTQGAASEQGDQADEADEVDEQEVNWLFVMTTTSGHYDGSMLTLNDVPPTLLFSDRPVRAFGHMQTPALIEELAGETGKDNFLEDPPNAVLSTFRPGEQPTAATVILVEKPIVEGSSLSMKVTLQDGEIPAEFGPASLFIDQKEYDEKKADILKDV